MKTTSISLFTLLLLNLPTLSRLANDGDVFDTNNSGPVSTEKENHFSLGPFLPR